MPTRRLLAVLGAIVVLGVGAALALAAGSGGPAPPPEPLAHAVHDALTASAPAGITARVQFTNRMLDSAGMESSDPVLTGAGGRLWWGGEHRLRLELQSDQGDAQVVVHGRRFFLYDGANDTAYAGLLPGERRAARPKAERVPTVARIQRALKRLMGRAVVSDAVPGNVAGQPAYNVRVAPRRAGGLL